MKLSVYLKFLFAALAIISFNACGDGSGNDTDPEDVSFDQAGDEVTTEQVEFRETFGQGGNLWKPSGDDHGSSPGAVVIILGPKHNKEFDYCEFKTKGGQVKRATCINNVPWTHTPYSCFANPSHGGDRQHWRTYTSCYDMAEVYAACYLGNKKYIFTAPGGQGAAICTRFG